MAFTKHKLDATTAMLIMIIIVTADAGSGCHDVTAGKVVHNKNTADNTAVMVMLFWRTVTGFVIIMATAHVMVENSAK